jgi:hypothetical protein
MNSPHPIALVFLMAASLLNAQDKSAAGPRVRALLLTPGGANIHLHTLAMKADGSPAEARGPHLIGARGLSDPISPGASTFSFAIPSKTEKSGFRSVAAVVLPPGSGDVIVLLEPAEGRFSPHLVRDSEPRFRGNSLLFFNATDVAIGASLGGEKFLIPPRKPTIASVPRMGDRPWYQVAFYEPQPQNQSRIITNTRWPHRESARSYIFFYRNGSSQRICHHSVDEILISSAADSSREAPIQPSISSSGSR